MRFFLICAMAWLAAICAAADEPLPAQFMPSSELRPGMVGEGRTVFHGFKPETFKATILGVRHNALPGANMIIARLEGPMLEGHGVVAGMSGSPVFVDGRLIGAVAYGWSFSYEPLCGITPIESMWQVWNNIGKPGLAKQKSRAAGPDSLAASAPWDWQKDWSALQGTFNDPALGTKPLDRSARSSAFKIDEPGLSGFVPLATPIFVSGAPPSAVRYLSRFFKAHNLEVIDAGPLAAAGGGEAKEPAPPIEPGSALGVPMLIGEMNVAGVGTVTWRDGDKMIAFGHPMMNAGGASVPLSAAWIVTFMQSYERSFKLGEVSDLVGTMDQDRQFAIGGTLGQAPPFIPIDVRIGGAAASNPRVFHYKAWKDADFFPSMAMVAVAAAWANGGGGIGEMTMAFDYTIKLTDGRTITKHALDSTDSGAVAAPLEAILFDLFMLEHNPYAEADIASLSVDLDVREGRRDEFEIVSLTPEHNRYLAGDTVRMKLRLRRWRGSEEIRPVELKLPKTLKPGSYAIQLADAEAALGIERMYRPAVFAPRRFEDLFGLIDAMNLSPDQLRLYLFEPTTGLVIKGAPLGRIPASIESLVRETAPAPMQQQAVGTRLDMQVLTLEAPISGSAALAIEVVDHFNE